MSRMTYADRSTLCQNALAKKLFLLIEKKKSNLALSADVTKAEELIQWADQIGPEICVLKTHIDILEDFHPDVIKTLKNLAKKHDFFIFEDRKFADIGNTVKHQYAKGIYHISEWADLINAHGLPGPGMISGLAEEGLSKERGLLLIAEMSSKENLITSNYIETTLRLAEQHANFVMGFIAQKKLSRDAKWIYFTPGVQLNENQDALGQQYITPEKAIIENESDIIIVGRGILNAKDPLATAKHYREAGWNAYEFCSRN